MPSTRRSTSASSSEGSWDALSTSSGGTTSSSGSSSFDVVTATRFAPVAVPQEETDSASAAVSPPPPPVAAAGAQPSPSAEQMRLSRAAESSYLASQEAGVPNFIRNWFERGGAPAFPAATDSGASSSQASPAASTPAAPARKGELSVEPAWTFQEDAASARGEASGANVRSAAPLSHAEPTMNTRVWFDAAAERAAQFLRAASSANSETISSFPAVAPPPPTPAVGDAAAGTPATAAEAPHDGADEEVADEEEEEAEDASWVLERFLRRRREKVAVGSDDVDADLVVDDEKDIIGAAQGRRAAMGAFRTTWSYECKWRGHAAPTWESRQLLEDEGFGPEVDWFDAWLGKGQRKVGAGHPPAPPPSARTATTPAQFEAEIAEAAVPLQDGQAAAGPAAPQADDSIAVPGLDAYDFDRSAAQLDFDALFADVDECIAADFNAWAVVHRVARCDKPTKNNRFAAAWAAARAHGFDVTPVMLYHGTRRANVRSIIRKGLVVPGTQGVRMQNGAVHGVGIYTSRAPDWSARYCDALSNDSRMLAFACVGLVGSQGSAEYNGHMHVFTHSDNVLPVWLIEFSMATYSMDPASLGRRPARVPLPAILADEYRRAAIHNLHADAEERRKREVEGVVRAAARQQLKSAREKVLAEQTRRMYEAGTAQAGAPAEAPGPRGDPRANGEMRGVAVVDGQRVKGVYVSRGVKRGDLRGESKAVKDLVRSGDIKVAKSRRRSRGKRGSGGGGDGGD